MGHYETSLDALFDWAETHDFDPVARMVLMLRDELDATRERAERAEAKLAALRAELGHAAKASEERAARDETPKTR